MCQTSIADVFGIVLLVTIIWMGAFADGRESIIRTLGRPERELESRIEALEKKHFANPQW